MEKKEEKEKNKKRKEKRGPPKVLVQASSIYSVQINPETSQTKEFREKIKEFQEKIKEKLVPYYPLSKNQTLELEFELKDFESGIKTTFSVRKNRKYYKEYYRMFYSRPREKIIEDKLLALSYFVGGFLRSLGFEVPAQDIETNSEKIMVRMKAKRLKKINNALKKYKKKLKEIKKTEEIEFKLPPDTTWEDIEIRFKNEYDVEIYRKGKFFIKSNHEKMGFFKSGTKDKQPNMQWYFLIVLSVLQEKDEKEATKYNIATSLGKRFNKKISENNCEKIKSKLSKKLREIFGINDEPFYPYKDYGYYKPKFKLKPIPLVRGSGEPYITKGSRYNDNIRYKDTESETL